MHCDCGFILAVILYLYICDLQEMVLLVNEDFASERPVASKGSALKTSVNSTELQQE